MDREKPKEISIPEDKDFSWGFLGWLLLYLGGGFLLVLLFVQFTASWVWAITLVGFMLGFMTLMGRWASGDERWK